MIAKIECGAGFRGSAAHPLVPEHLPEVVGDSMAGPDIVNESSRATRQVRPDIEE